MSDQKSGETKIEIHIDDETAQGIYANLAIVNHTDSEFTIDFVYAQPQVPKAKVRSRIITSPRHLRRLIGVLQEQLQHYEKMYGSTLPAPPPTPDDGPVH